MNLATGGVVTRNKVWEKPASKLIIRAVKNMADKQGISTLKLMGKHKTRITPTTWSPNMTND